MPKNEYNFEKEQFRAGSEMKNFTEKYNKLISSSRTQSFFEIKHKYLRKMSANNTWREFAEYWNEYGSHHQAV